MFSVIFLALNRCTYRQSDEVLKDSSMKNEQVRQIVESYYVSVKFMMISHSNLLRIAYLLAKKFNPFPNMIAKYFPEGSQFIGALRVTLFADCEIQQLHNFNKI